MQLVVDAGTIPEDTLKQITTGSSLAATGTLVESPAKGQAVELKVASIHLYGSADPQTYPLQKKGHTLEFLREISHLRVRSNTFGAAFRLRNALTHAIHLFLPGARVYLCAHADRHDFGLRRRRADVRRVDIEHAAAAAHGRRQNRLAEGLLRQAGVPHRQRPARRRNLRPAFSKVYTFGPTFRAENSNTPRHLAEFWMVEPEMAFYELEDNMRLAEEFLKYTIRYVLEHCREDLEFFNQFIEKTVLATLRACRPVRLRPYHLHRRHRRAQEIRQDLGVSRRVGQRPADRA